MIANMQHEGSVSDLRKFRYNTKARRVVFPDNVLFTSHGVQARRLNKQKM